MTPAALTTAQRAERYLSRTRLWNAALAARDAGCHGASRMLEDEYRKRYGDHVPWSNFHEESKP